MSFNPADVQALQGTSYDTAWGKVYTINSDGSIDTQGALPKLEEIFPEFVAGIPADSDEAKLAKDILHNPNTNTQKRVRIYSPFVFKEIAEKFGREPQVGDMLLIGFEQDDWRKIDWHPAYTSCRIREVNR